MRWVQVLSVAAVLSLAIPVLAYAEDEHGGHGEHRGWDRGGDHDGWRGGGGERGEERGEERREERHEERNEWPSFGFYNFGYTTPRYDNGYNYDNYDNYQYAPHCRWIVRRYYDDDGDLVSRRVKICS